MNLRSLRGENIRAIHSYSKQWLNYIGNVQNKVNLFSFLADAWCDIGVNNLLEGQQLVIGGGFKNAQRLKWSTEDTAKTGSPQVRS